MQAQLPHDLEFAFGNIEQALQQFDAACRAEHVAHADQLEPILREKASCSNQLPALLQDLQRALKAHGQPDKLSELAASSDSSALRSRAGQLLLQIKESQQVNAVGREVMMRKTNGARALAASLQALKAEQPILADAPSAVKHFAGVSSAGRPIGQA
jgi:hypothetical protein